MTAPVIAHVQGNTCGTITSSGLSLTATLGSGITQGNLVVITYVLNDTVDALAAPSGFSNAGSDTVSTKLDVQVLYAVVTSAMAGETSFTVSWTTNTAYYAWAIDEFSSSTGWTASPLGSHTEAVESTASTAISTGTAATTSQSVELLYAMIGWNSSGQTISGITANWTQIASIINTGKAEGVTFYETTTTQLAPVLSATLSTAEVNGGVVTSFIPVLADVDSGTGSDVDNYLLRLSQADTGTGSDIVFNVKAAISSTDTGTGSDAVFNVTAAISSTDTGTGSDAVFSVKAATLGLEAGSGAESGTLATTLAGSDTGTAADAQQPRMSLIDSGTGSDAGNYLMFQSQVDTGIGSDAVFNVTAAISSTDTGSGSDSVFNVNEIVPSSDTGSGVDTYSLSISSSQVSDVDAGTSLDAVTSFNAALSSFDSGTGQDQYWTGGETGHGTESQSVGVSLADTGTGSDIVFSVKAVVPSTDAGTGSDVDTYVLHTLPQADTGSGAETQAVSVHVAGYETATGVEAYRLTASSAGSDTATGADTELDQLFSSDYDLASGVDTESVFTGAQFIQDVDSGSGDDEGYVFVLVEVVADVDAGTGADSGYLPAFSDSGLGVDGGEQVLLPDIEFGTGTDSGYLPAFSDSGTGADTEGLLEIIPVADVDAGTGADSGYGPVNDFGAGVDGGEQVSLSDIDAAAGADGYELILYLPDTAAGSDSGLPLTATAADSDIGLGGSLFTHVEGAVTQQDTDVTSAEVTLSLPIENGDLLAGIVFVPDIANLAISDTAGFDWHIVLTIGSVALVYAVARDAPDGDTITVTSDLAGGCALLVDHFSAEGIAVAGVSGSHDYTDADVASGVLGSVVSPGDGMVWGALQCADADITFTVVQALTGTSAANSGGSVFSAYIPDVSPGRQDIAWDANGQVGIGDASGVQMFFSLQPFLVVTGPVDTGAGGDSQRFSLSASDAASGSDSQGLLAIVPATDSDTASGSDSQGLLEIFLVSDVDAGAGSDSGTVSVADRDAGSLAEASQSVYLASLDTASGADAGTSNVLLRLDVDAGNGTDGGEQVTVSQAGSDTGTGYDQVDQAGSVYYRFSSDSGRFQEGDQEPAFDIDGAIGTESWQLAQSDVEAATGLDSGTVFVLVQPVSDQDFGAATDLWATAAAWSGTDTGTGSDAGQAVLVLQPVSDQDAGNGADVAVPIGIWPFPPPWLFAVTGGYLLIWRPGTTEERVVRRFDRLEPWVVSYAEMIRFSDSLLDVASCDTGSGGDASGPTATVRQYATGPQIRCRVPS